METKNIGVAVGAIVILVIAAFLLWPDAAPENTEVANDAASQPAATDTADAANPEAATEPMAGTADESAPSATEAPTSTLDLEAEVTVDGEMGNPAITLSAANFAFSQTEIRVKRGDTVTITLDNEEGFHDLMIDEFNVATKKLQAGQRDTVTFVADQAGTFEYYCSVGNHRAMGMKGTLVVE